MPATGSVRGDAKACAAATAGAIGVGPKQRGEQAAVPSGRVPRFPDDSLPALVLDSLGRIRSCTSAAVALLGGAKSAELLGQSIARLLPDLPIREGTLGYNSAYIAFWFGNGQWWGYEAVDGGETFMVLAVSVEPIDRADGGGFLMSLRPRCPVAEIDIDLH